MKVSKDPNEMIGVYSYFFVAQKILCDWSKNLVDFGGGDYV